MFMDMFGIISGICFAISGMPQAYKAMRSGNAHALNPMTIWLVITGSGSMLCYVLAKYGFDWYLSGEHFVTMTVWCTIARYYYFPRTIASHGRVSPFTNQVQPAMPPSRLMLLPHQPQPRLSQSLKA